MTSADQDTKPAMSVTSLASNNDQVKESESDSAAFSNKIGKAIAVIRAIIAAFVLVAAVVVAQSWVTRQPEAMATWSVLFSLATILWALLSCTKHSVLLLFELGYFIFIYGRVFAVLFLGAENLPYGGKNGVIGLAGTYGVDPVHVTDSFGLFFIFNLILIFVYCAVFYGYSYWQKTREPSQKATKSPRYAQPVMQKTIKYAFYVSVPFALINGWYAISYVREHGYFSYAQVRNEVTPSIFMYGAEFSLVAFFAFLATKPRMRELFVPLVLFVLTRSILILTGNRNSVILPLLAVVIYLLARGIDWKAIRRHPVISSAIAVVALVFIVVGINSISRVNAARGTRAQSGDAISAALMELGVTGNLPILLTEKGYLEKIPDHQGYALGPFINFFQSRILGPIYGDGRFDYLQGASAEQALRGHSFAHTFSYFYMGDSYLDGAGFGSSAPVELWVDAGMVGVVIGAAIYGILFLALQHFLTRPFWPSLVSILIVQRIPWTPRASYSEPFLSFNVRVLAGLVVLVLLMEAVLFAQKKRAESKSAVVAAPPVGAVDANPVGDTEIEDRQRAKQLVAADQAESDTSVAEERSPEPIVEPELTPESELVTGQGAVPVPALALESEPSPEKASEAEQSLDEEPARTEQPIRAEKPARTEQPIRAEKPARTEQPIRAEELDHAEEPVRVSESVQHVEHAEKSELRMKLEAVGESLLQLAIAYALTLLGKLLRKIAAKLLEKLTRR